MNFVIVHVPVALQIFSKRKTGIFGMLINTDYERIGGETRLIAIE